MYYMFMDNFRGFSETIVPLGNANFLVGENSTGKSSFLTLLALFSTPNFWFVQDFSPGEFSNLGGFNDIVSVCSPIRNRFTVGFLDMLTEREEEDQARRYSFVLMTFRNEEGMPKLTRYIQYRNGKLLKVFFLATTTKFKLLDRFPNFKDENEFLQFVRVVFHEDLTDRKGFTRLPKSIPAHAPPTIISTLIQSIDKPRKKGRIPLPELPVTLGLTWLAPIRTKPRRTYDGFKTDFTPEGDHTPYVIRKTLGSGKKAKNLVELLKSFGESSGLFSTVVTHTFGRGPSAPFEVQIELFGARLNISNVGYGVSQILPVLIEMLTRPKGHWFAIQQPEIHLHPRAQASLGELMHFMVQDRQHHYLVETHSEYLIDRFRLRIKDESGPTGSQVIFFERTEEGNKTYSMQINERGQYPKNQPKNFRDFFIQEEIRLLDI